VRERAQVLERRGDCEGAMRARQWSSKGATIRRGRGCWSDTGTTWELRGRTTPEQQGMVAGVTTKQHVGQWERRECRSGVGTG
jgi:hypothetical protein